MIDRLREALARPVDSAWLCAFRVLFGATMCVSMLRFIAYDWIDSFFVRPGFHFKYYGFAWLEPLPRLGMHALFWLLALLALLMAIGVFVRISAIIFALLFTYLQLLDVTTYLNHYYLASLLALLIAVSPSHRVGSVLTLRRPSLADPQIANLWLVLFRFQVGVVYSFAGLAKAHSDWLIHAQPLRIWLAARTDLPVVGPLLTLQGVPELMSWAGFLFDMSIPWLLSSARVRPFAFVAVVTFHVLTRLLFSIGMFPVIMVLSALVFFPPSWPRHVLGRLGMSPQRRAAPSSSPRSQRSISNLHVALFASYCLLQVAMPMRFLAYDGNVRWHEQGMRFSWRVMVREKNGSVTFIVRQKSTGRSFYVSPHGYLTRVQEREMSGQPDLVLQLAHHIRDDYAQRGFGDVEVRADVLVSLNGRRMRRLIDPAIDLATISDELSKAPWILPAPDEAPPHVRPI